MDPMGVYPHYLTFIYIQGFFETSQVLGCLGFLNHQ